MFCPAFFITCFLPFSPLSSMAFCTIPSRFLHFMHFQYIFPRVLPVSFSFQSFLHHFLWLLSHFPALSLYFSSMFTASSFVPSSRSGFLHVPTDFAPFILVVITFSCQVVITFSFTVSFQHFPVDFARFPLIVIMFSCSFYFLFVGFQSIHAFLIYFSKIFTRLLFAPFPLVCCIFNVSKSFTRLLHFPIVFAPFPLVVIAFSCTFTVFFQHVYCIVIVCS